MKRDGSRIVVLGLPVWLPEAAGGVRVTSRALTGRLSRALPWLLILLAAGFIGGSGMGTLTKASEILDGRRAAERSLGCHCIHSPGGVG